MSTAVAAAVELRPAPCDLREPAGVQRVLRIMREGITLAESATKAANGEVATLRTEVANADKGVAALMKVSTLPANIASKLAVMRDRLAQAERNAEVQGRILSAKKAELAIWMAQGSPTNASLCESDSLLDKALDAVRRAVGF